MSKGSIDDNDPQVIYGGDWTLITRAGPSGNSLHSVMQSGASATVHFTGITGKIIGTIPQCVAETDTVWVAFILDQKVVGQVHQPCSGGTNQDGFTFYDTGTLPGGNQQHVLSAVNQGDTFPFQLDMFVWAAIPDATQTTVVDTPSPRLVAGNPSSTTTTSVSSVTSAIQLGTNTSSTRSVGSPTSMTSGIAMGAAASASGSSTTTMSVAPASAPTGSGPSDTHGSSSPSSPPIGLIVGCVLGVLLFLILLIILIYCIRRRRIHARSTTQQPISAEGITPFQLVENTTDPSTHFALYPDVENRRQSLLLPPTQLESKIDPQLEGSSSLSLPVAVPYADEKRPLPQHEESPPPQPSLDPQSSTLRESLLVPAPAPAPLPPRPPSTISSLYPSEVAPAYRPRQSDMSTFFNFGIRASLIAEAPPSYDS